MTNDNEAKTLYRLNWEGSLEAVQVVKETEHYVFFDDYKEKKHSQWAQYFSTREEAKAFAIDKIAKTIVSTEKELVGLEYRLAAAQDF